ncbi:nucleotide exchange factor GrpE, partial [Arthrospira platensis SPKY1]|nr:nucleotide exchange factor GrpE [Arthrospira platensis SPKY1]
MPASEEVLQELADLKEQMIRVLADNQNIKRRAEADRYRHIDEARARYIQLFLPVYDDLVRSLEMSAKLDVPESFLEGIRMVNQKFAQIFERENVERIDA